MSKKVTKEESDAFLESILSLFTPEERAEIEESAYSAMYIAPQEVNTLQNLTA
ncbi:hypothetical protein HNV12_24560 [Methanococcoides sp. SA1]|nr:hypothetical protein [Methanococcoides sp. SA1]